jgi:hypothetical protein
MVPSAFYAPSPASQAIAEQARKDQLKKSIAPLLQPTSFTGAGAVKDLIGLITGYGIQDVDADLRKEILTKIRENAGNHYYRAWLENANAMDATREWLKAAATAPADSPLVDTIMSLLHVRLLRSILRSRAVIAYINIGQIIERLPFTLETLKASKLGKVIVKLAKDEPTPGKYASDTSVPQKSVIVLLRHKIILWALPLMYTIILSFEFTDYCIFRPLESEVHVSHVDCIRICSDQGHGIEYRASLAINGPRQRHQS